MRIVASNSDARVVSWGDPLKSPQLIIPGQRLIYCNHNILYRPIKMSDAAFLKRFSLSCKATSVRLQLTLLSLNPYSFALILHRSVFWPL